MRARAPASQSQRDDKFHFVSRRATVGEEEKGWKKSASERRSRHLYKIMWWVCCLLLMPQDASIKRAASRVATRVGLGPHLHPANHSQTTTFPFSQRHVPRKAAFPTPPNEHVPCTVYMYIGSTGARKMQHQQLLLVGVWLFERETPTQYKIMLHSETAGSISR